MKSYMVGQWMKLLKKLAEKTTVPFAEFLGNKKLNNKFKKYQI